MVGRTGIAGRDVRDIFSELPRDHWFNYALQPIRDGAGKVMGTRAAQSARLPMVTALQLMRARGAEGDSGGHISARPQIDGGPSRRVLVVDDNEDAAMLLAEALRSFSHQVA